MTARTQPVTLFRRRMRLFDHCGMEWRLGRCIVWQGADGMWRGECDETLDETRWFHSPHAAARALECKIESQWKRLGKLMGKEGKK